jgi:hypothetical protein
MKNNYLFFHINPIKQEIFYVGIGRLNRPYSSTGRNKWWHNIVNKYGYDVIIIHENLTWDEACELEIKYISQIGRANKGLGTLINLTDGDQGFRGNHSLQTKEKMKQNAIANPNYGMKGKRYKSIIQLDLENNVIAYFSSAKEASEKLNISRSSISLAIKGTYSHAGGYKWSFK